MASLVFHLHWPYRPVQNSCVCQSVLIFGSCTSVCRRLTSMPLNCQTRHNNSGRKRALQAGGGKRIHNHLQQPDVLDRSSQYRVWRRIFARCSPQKWNWHLYHSLRTLRPLVLGQTTTNRRGGPSQAHRSVSLCSWSIRDFWVRDSGPRAYKESFRLLAHILAGN